MIKVHEIIAMLNFPDAPLIPNLRQESTSSLMINNNITVTEIEEPIYDNIVKINSSSIDDDIKVNTEHKHLRTPQAMNVN
jgi:hypothetical protein